jgi:hypothetical protein
MLQKDVQLKTIQNAALEGELETTKRAKEVERIELVERIDANARGRLSGYKASLELGISPLISDLPREGKTSLRWTAPASMHTAPLLVVPKSIPQRRVTPQPPPFFAYVFHGFEERKLVDESE